MGFTYDDSRLLDQCAYDLVLGDYPRSLNRAKINSLANGEPPFSQEEADSGNVKTNVNDLSLTRLCHDSRAQFSNGLLTPGLFFTASTDLGPKHKRSINSQIVQREANRVLKESISYFETMRSKIGSLVLHGIAPAVWENEHVVCPRAIGIEDALIPSETLLGFENLPFFMLRRSFTAKELQIATCKAKRDPGWNMPLVNRCLEWVDNEMLTSSTNWKEVWSPEKWTERIKADNGFYSTDQAPTVDCFDIYGWVEGDNKNPSGWVRRIILDTWSNPEAGNSMSRDDKMKDRKGKSLKPKEPDDFLFTSRSRVIADDWKKIVSFQFADLSAVTPYRYHSVRSLGWMLFAPCHIKNRLTGRFYDSAFEALLQYFQVDSSDDIQRAMKIELANMGIIDSSIRPVPAKERWQPNANLVELAMQTAQQSIDTNSKSSTGQPSPQTKERETNLQRMADLQAVNALTSAALQQAYAYAVFEQREIFRRLCILDSRDTRARDFQARCIAQGVPEKLLHNPEAWDIQSEKMTGGGNQTLELMIGQQLMGLRQSLDPEPQRIVTRDFIAAITKNPQKAIELVPEQPAKGTPSMHDASLVAGTLMQGIPVEVQTGINHIEYVETMLKILAQQVQLGMKQGGMVDPEKLKGLMAIAQNIAQHIKIIAQDPAEKQRVKKYGDILGKLGNELKAFGQRLQEAMKKRQAQAGNKGNGVDPDAVAKAQSTMLLAQTKAKTTEASAAQRLKHKEIAFKQKSIQSAQQHQADISAKDLETAANIRRGRINLFDEEED